MRCIHTLMISNRKLNQFCKVNQLKLGVSPWVVTLHVKMGKNCVNLEPFFLIGDFRQKELFA